MTDAATEDELAHLAALPDSEQRDIIRVRSNPLGNFDEQRIEEDDERTSSD
ncbi:MAG TPA: hypothetical protein VNA25_06940 [Phycisphaerae bacterium]|nr:hypothetical protein [Phycisphaerae bacterium]